MTTLHDVVVIGAGAAGMMCAAVAGQRGRRVMLIDHAQVPGEKIRISGGGRCNFTNLHAGPDNFLSANPRFCRSALAGYTPADFVALMRRHRVSFHEKHRGQLFCDDSAQDVINLIRNECAEGAVEWRLGCGVSAVSRDGDRFEICTDAGKVAAKSLVIATGGLSIPKMGASDFGYRVARQFGLRIVDPRPGLVPLVFQGDLWKPYVDLAGLSLEADIRCAGARGRVHFREDLLLTHRGLSGPGILQISSYWQPGESISIDLTPQVDWEVLVRDKGGRRGGAATMLGGMVPRRLAELLVQMSLAPNERERPVADLPDKSLRQLATRVADWRMAPNGTEGFKKAEVTVGGVDTRDLSSQTMGANAVPGLYFIGEVVDVTGWLGGYNFQWAWASAVACARGLR